MEDTLSIQRVKDFIKKHPYQKKAIYNSSNEEKVPICGFWLSTEQLLELTLDLMKQQSTGIAFAVGCHDYVEEGAVIYDTHCKEKAIQWYSVEAIPLSKGNEITILGEIRGEIRGRITELILHAFVSKEGSEAQRFPPPAP